MNLKCALDIMKSKSLVACINFKKVKLEVHVLANIFDIGLVSPPRPRFLVNSGNEYLVSTALPYFPRGGLPRVNNVLGGPGSWQMSSSWGGMSAGDNMVYPAQTIDGGLAQRCPDLATWIREHVPPVSWDTRAEDERPGPRLRRLHLTRDSVRCETGGCVWSPVTEAGKGDLASDFSLGVLHTVAPYDSDPDRDQRLAECYSNCLKVADTITLSTGTSLSIVTCLLGTGVKCIDRALSAAILRERLDTINDDAFNDNECSVELVLQSEQIFSEVLPVLGHQ